jgi:hypothetical protein
MVAPVRSTVAVTGRSRAIPATSGLRARGVSAAFARSAVHALMIGSSRPVLPPAPSIKRGSEERDWLSMARTMTRDHPLPRVASRCTSASSFGSRPGCASAAGAPAAIKRIAMSNGHNVLRVRTCTVPPGHSCRLGCAAARSAHALNRRQPSGSCYRPAAFRAGSERRTGECTMLQERPAKPK